MKYIVTHTSPDWDAIGSVWVLKKYLAGWQHAKILYVPAGTRVVNSKIKIQAEDQGTQVTNEAIEIIGQDEYAHVDTGLGPLDHHQNNDQKVCGASKCWDYVQNIINEGDNGLTAEHIEAVSRIVKILVEIDHFREIFWGDPTEDYQEFSLIGALDGMKLEKPNQDDVYMEFGINCLNALVNEFENRIWAEKEIKEKGIEFQSRWGKAIGFETLNDTVIKLSQKMGYILVLRKDPRKGYVRIKLRPTESPDAKQDLTLAYESLNKIDPDATWYLHVSKKMLLNGTPKNPLMVPTKLDLHELITILEKI